MPRSSSQATSTRKPTPRTRRTGGARRTRRATENSDVLVSAVISTYLLTHLHQHLAEFQVPSRLFLRAEPLPRIASGKFNKLSVREALLTELGIAPD